jgi:hypothetical protein
MKIKQYLRKSGSTDLLVSSLLSYESRTPLIVINLRVVEICTRGLNRMCTRSLRHGFRLKVYRFASAYQGSKSATMASDRSLLQQVHSQSISLELGLLLNAVWCCRLVPRMATFLHPAAHNVSTAVDRFNPRY